jgi:DNA repair protein RadC
MGLVNRTIVHPRECFYHAVKDMAVAVIFIHNHPSGSTNASPEDDEVTERMSMASEIMGFNFLDHIIITPQEDYFSYRQAGKMPNKHEGYELEAFVKSLSNHYGDTPNSYQGEQHEQLELYFN